MNTFVPLSEPIKQELLAKLCECLEDAVFILDAKLRYMWVNRQYEIVVGYDKEFLIQRPLGIYASEFLTEKERTVLKDIANRLDKHGYYENNFSMATRYGETLNCQMTFRRIILDDGFYHVAMIKDISSATKNQEKLAHLLNYDQLTGLPNRKVFLSQTSELLLESYQEVVIVRFNIDRYRTLANTLGQDHVDDLINQFIIRVNDLNMTNLRCFSHFGSDDFALLFEFDDANMVRNELDKLMQMCEQPFVTHKHPIYLQLSAGVSYFPEHGRQMMVLLNKAEKALHHVKQQGGDDVCWYQAQLDVDNDERLKLEAELRDAINQAQFEPYYQPKVDLQTGAIVGFEALVRWQHPTRGILRPHAFIDAIIRHKLSFELFSQLADKIAQQLRMWQTMGFCQHICINADAAEFSHPKFFTAVRDLFDRHDIYPQLLHIEMTESSLMLRHNHVKQQLTDLKNLGVHLALDDFGTGYASLSYLQEYNFDFLKIDRSFVSKIESDSTQYAIVKAILSLAEALNMGVVAEGIETESQRDLLADIGCQYGQGYWFGKPMPADIATALLVEQYAKTE